VTRLPASVRVPHIGWNTVNGRYFYFDHSYAAHPADESIVDGCCEPGKRLAGSIRTGSILAVRSTPKRVAARGSIY
jgi:imidazole glycerol-phosphate synthase subunit HisH